MICISASAFRLMFHLMFRVAIESEFFVVLRVGFKSRLGWNNIKVEMEQCTGSSLISPLHHQLSALSSYGIMQVASFTHLKVNLRRWANSRLSEIFIMAFISDGSILSTLSLFFISLFMPMASKLLCPTAAKDSV